jgi:hypothetical protein
VEVGEGMGREEKREKGRENLRGRGCKEVHQKLSKLNSEVINNFFFRQNGVLFRKMISTARTYLKTS